MTLQEEQAEFAHDVSRLLQFIFNNGYCVTLGEFERTPEQQEIYIKTGKSKTYNSYHLRKVACDLFFFKDGKLTYDTQYLKPVGYYWQSLNPKNKAGMFWKNFPDVPHFERQI